MTKPESREESEVLARIEADRRAFENHWLWRELGTTPSEFFAAVDAHVAASGIPRAEWDEKILAAKYRIEERVRREREPRREFPLSLLAAVRV